MKATKEAKRSAKVGRAQATPKAALQKVRGGAQKAAGKRARGEADVLAGRVEPYAEGARKVLAHQASEAREWAEPRLEQAAETVQEAVQKDIAPRVSSALTSAAERSAPAREEALERGIAALAALKGEGPPAPAKRRRWPLALLTFFVGGLVGAAGGVLGQRLAGPASSVSAGSGPGGPSADPSAEFGHDSGGEGSAPGRQP